MMIAGVVRCWPGADQAAAKREKSCLLYTGYEHRTAYSFLSAESLAGLRQGTADDTTPPVPRDVHYEGNLPNGTPYFRTSQWYEI